MANLALSPLITQYLPVSWTVIFFFRIVVHVIVGPLRIQLGLLFTICVDASSPCQPWQALIDLRLFTNWIMSRKFYITLLHTSLCSEWSVIIAYILHTFWYGKVFFDIYYINDEYSYVYLFICLFCFSYNLQCKVLNCTLLEVCNCFTTGDIMQHAIFTFCWWLLWFFT